jgi:hypothetical protein
MMAMGFDDGGEPGGGGIRVTSLACSLPSSRVAVERSVVLLKQLRHPNVLHYLRHAAWNGKTCSVTGLPPCHFTYAYKGSDTAASSSSGGRGPTSSCSFTDAASLPLPASSSQQACFQPSPAFLA